MEWSGAGPRREGGVWHGSWSGRRTMMLFLKINSIMLKKKFATFEVLGWSKFILRVWTRKKTWGLAV